MNRCLPTLALLCSLGVAAVGANMVNTEMPLLRGKPTASNALAGKAMMPQPSSLGQIDKGLSDVADLRRPRNIAIFT